MKICLKALDACLACIPYVWTKPSVQQYIPQEIKDKVKAELDRMTEMGVIVKQEEHLYRGQLDGHSH